METRAGADVRRPPTRWLLGYYLLGLRLPREHGSWVAEDVATHARVRRLMAVRMLPLAVALAAVAILFDAPAVLGGLAVTVVVGQLLPARSRQQVLAFQRVDGLGRPVASRGLARLSNGGLWAGTALLLVGILLVLSAL